MIYENEEFVTTSLISSIAKPISESSDKKQTENSVSSSWQPSKEIVEIVEKGAKLNALIDEEATNDDFDDDDETNSDSESDEEDYKKYFEKPCCADSEINYEFYSYETSVNGRRGRTNASNSNSKCSPPPPSTSSNAPKAQPADRVYSDFSQFYESASYFNTSNNRASPASFQPPPFILNRY